MKKVLIIVLMLVIGLSCKKNTAKLNPVPTDYLIFGTDGGMMEGSYIYFKIQDNKIYATTPYIRGQSSIIYNTEPLPAGKYAIAKELKDSFPNYLLNHPDQTFGCPNCVDQGAIYLEIKQNEEVKYWHIDTNVGEQPAEIRPYIQKLIQVVVQLK